jgi:hypothetical protein
LLPPSSRNVQVVKVHRRHAASVGRVHTDDGESKSPSDIIPPPVYTASHPRRPQCLVISNTPDSQCAMYYINSPRFQQNYEGIFTQSLLMYINLSRSLATYKRNELKQRQSNVSPKNKGKLEICLKRYVKRTITLFAVEKLIRSLKTF